MASIRLRESVASIPESARRVIRSGFENAASINATQQATLIDQFSRAIALGGGSLNSAEVSKETGLDADTARSIITAISFLVGILSSGDFELEDVLSEAKGILFDAKDEPQVRSLAATILNDKGRWRETLDERNLATETLPSFISFHVSVDLRLKFEDEQITQAVPIAVVRLETDIAESDLWFQMTKGDVEGLIKKLNKILENMTAANAAAEKMASARP